jgi:hypothetical protein
MSTQEPDQPETNSAAEGSTLAKKRTRLKIAGGVVGSVVAVGIIAVMAIGRSKADDDETAASTSEPDVDATTTCRDGWNSSSAGQGTCSHHGGVA